ncbi:hypothetical protein [Stratiformator vulcanicus]|uniref:Uncharacterized protein n=1 Tax=Stratiformator vulcanicus TaxID=2527980 RepID=A0A517R217_9PLAN|nr:hypothetical protein [Stratiformator vulcanicus]QDT37901.1 hypothetical protein Pan189_22840 [Stratiformator vulcanicus]
MSDLIVVWTVRLAIGCYLLRWLLVAARIGTPGFHRKIWTVGALSLLAHLAAAFQFVHRWSHASAYQAVRVETFEATGWDSGFGVWINYAFALVWAFDASLWWIKGDRWAKWWPGQIVVQSFLAFIVFQATVIFGPGWWKVVGVIIAALFAFALIRLSRSHGSGLDHHSHE